MRSQTTNLANNQVVITYLDDNGSLTGEQDFFSYGTLIAQLRPNKLPVLSKKYWDYSRTTTKYLARFLGCSGKKMIQDRINKKKYELSNEITG